MMYKMIRAFLQAFLSVKLMQIKIFGSKLMAAWPCPCNSTMPASLLRYGCAVAAIQAMLYPCLRDEVRRARGRSALCKDVYESAG